MSLNVSPIKLCQFARLQPQALFSSTAGLSVVVGFIRRAIAPLSIPPLTEGQAALSIWQSAENGVLGLYHDSACVVGREWGEGGSIVHVW